MYTSLRAAVLGFALISTIATASAVQLASFAPRIEISNAQCRAAYTTTIDGCIANDFATGATCSAACVQGLVKIGEVINRVCKDVDVGETSIIGVFQNGIAIKALCPGASVTTISLTSSSTKAPAQTSAQPATSATSEPAAPPASTLTTSTSASTSTSQAENDDSSSSTSQGLVTDPDPTSVAPTSVATPPASTTATAGTTRAPNAQLSNTDSGGGSPFDVQAVGGSSRQRVIDLTMAAFLSTAVLFAACA